MIYVEILQSNKWDYTETNKNTLTNKYDKCLKAKQLHNDVRE